MEIKGFMADKITEKTHREALAVGLEKSGAFIYLFCEKTGLYLSFKKKDILDIETIILTSEEGETAFAILVNCAEKAYNIMFLEKKTFLSALSDLRRIL